MVDLNLDNVFKYTLFFWTLPLTRFHLTLAIISLPQKTSHSSADTEPSPLSSMAEKIFDLSSGVG